MIFRSAYDGLAWAVSVATATVCDPDEDRAVQAGRADADINELMRRFGKSGQLPIPRALPEYGDFSGVVDYQTALNQMMEAQESFESLPASVRARFANDPGRLWSFLHDPGNEAEARSLGLLEPLPAPVEPQLVRVVPEPAPAPPAAP